MIVFRRVKDHLPLPRGKSGYAGPSASKEEHAAFYWTISYVKTLNLK
jgi:hypothetical protein